jgi:YHS domain-containing protein
VKFNTPDGTADSAINQNISVFDFLRRCRHTIHPKLRVKILLKHQHQNMKGKPLTLKIIITSGLVVGIAVCAIGSTGVAIAKVAPVYTATFSSIALSGFNPVAYFTQKAAVKGMPKFATSYNDAKWHFSSAANLAAFVANPTRYAPQYGGYCAWAVSQGYTASGDPKVWQVVNGKLYVNYNQKVGKKWSKNISEHIVTADANWPTL